MDAGNLTRIKICGVRYPQIAHAAVRAGANAVGLVFVDGSPRRVRIDEAMSIIRILPAFVEPIALFVDPLADKVRQVTQELGVRTIQLHGRERPDLAAQLAPLRVIKAFWFDKQKLPTEVARWRQHTNLCGVLLDTPPPSTEALEGGRGETFDWPALAELRTSNEFTLDLPIILAGGLTPENVAHAIQTVRPFGVDVSSGVESDRGVKDPARIEAFCASVRRADRPDP